MSEANLRLVEDRPPSVPPPDPLVNRTLDGRYRIESVLGEGGMGLVYRARHVTLNKPLAIKVLRPEVSRDVEVMERFKQEAQSASAIGNYHIIDISDFGVLPDGSTYFVMEFLDGISLTEAIEEQQPIAHLRTVRIGQQLCDALGAAHERSIVHRDLKPDNIYLVKRGQDRDFVKVLDFGIAKVGGSSSKLTKAGQVFGTPHYMSPEQCGGKAVDARTDIYALGVILYEMTTGAVPFDADNLMGILTKHIYEAPVSPAAQAPLAHIPASLDAVIMKCLAKDLEQRYQTMADLRSDLALIEAELGGGEMGRGDLTGRIVAARDTSALIVGPRPRSKTPIMLAGALIVGLGVIAGAAAMAGVFSDPAGTTVAEGGGAGALTNEPANPTVGTTAVEPSTPEAPPEGPNGGPAVEGGEAEAHVATNAGATDLAAQLSPSVRIVSDPPGAEVILGEVVLGRTPIDVPRPREGGVVTALTLRLRGYRDVAVGVSAFSSETIEQTLDRASAGGRRPGGAAGNTMTNATPDTPPAATMETPQRTGGSSTPRGGDGLVDPWGGGGVAGGGR